jgi:hypothetical protein
MSPPLQKNLALFQILKNNFISNPPKKPYFKPSQHKILKPPPLNQPPQKPYFRTQFKAVSNPKKTYLSPKFQTSKTLTQNTRQT